MIKQVLKPGMKYLLLAPFIAIGLIMAMPSNVAQAVSGDDFRAGRIVDDAVFYNEDSMSITQIQNFLNSKVPSCDTEGEKLYKGTTRKAYAAARGVQTPFVCLKEFTMDTQNLAPVSGLCNNYAGQAGESAAQIIYKVAQACGINPQVLMITLQKEQSLITDDWPWPIQYTKATGYNCPDSNLSEDDDANDNGCEDWSEGFFMQVYWSARIFRQYRANASNRQYVAGRHNTILWHPNGGCGTSSVFIRNQATAALYIYTPYRPNRAALDNLYGTGNSCSSYGNRNFWRIFHDWFGSPYSSNTYKSMKSPRWMEMAEDAKKIDPMTGDEIGSLLVEGRKIYFDDKITIDGETYLRTRYDTERWENKVIPLSKLKEVEVNFTPLAEPGWMELTKDLYKINPRHEKNVGNKLEAGRTLYFSDSFEIGGVTYLRTQADTENGHDLGIPSDSLDAVDVEYRSLMHPRWFIAERDTRIYDLRYPSGSSSPGIPAGSKTLFTKKVTIDGRTYIAEDTPNPGEYLGVPLEYFDSIMSDDIAIRPTSHRAFKIMRDLQKTDLHNNRESGALLPAGTEIYLQSYIDLGEKRYYRSAFDTTHHRTTVIDRDDLEPIEVDFIPMEVPRKMVLKENLKKLDPVTMSRLDITLNEGQVISFDTKVKVNGKTYLRTRYDSNHNHYKVIPLSSLRNW